MESTKICLLFLLVLYVSCEDNLNLNDQVDCFRLQDSVYGHYINCSNTKPLPLKAQTTIQLDMDYYFNPYTSYSVYLMDGNGKTIFL